MGQSDHQQIPTDQQTSGRTAELAAINQKLKAEMTERKRAEEALQQCSKELSALNALSRRVSASLSVDQVVQAALEEVVGSVAINLALLYTRHGDELHLQGSYQKSLELQHTTAQLHRVGECLCGLAISQASPIYSSNIQIDMRCTLEECKAAGVRSFAALPLTLEGQVLGVLGMASMEEQDFGKQTAYLEALAGTIAIGLQNALLHQQVQRHIAALEQQVAERNRMEEALRKSERNYREIFDATSEAIFTHDADTGVILDVNQTMLEMYGYSREETLNLTINNLSSGEPPYTQQEAGQWIRRGIEQGPQLFEWLGRRKNGELFWAEVALTSSRIGGEGRILAVVRDISERKRAEEAIRRAEERYRDLYEEAPIMYVITRHQEGLPVIETCNRMFLTMLGYSRDEVQGRLLTDFYTPESRARLLDGGYRRQLEGQDEAEERGLVTRDGRVIQTLLTTRPEVNPEGRVTGTRAMFVDITARKYAEQALEESEQRFRRLAENAPDAIYRYEFVPEPRLVYASPATKTLSGYSPEELYADIDSAFKMVHAEDRSLLTSALQRPLGTGEPIVVRWVRKDGTLIWTEHRQAHVYDSAGRRVAVEGIARDITQRKWAEQALQESEARFRQRSTELVALHGISLHLNTVQELSDLLRLVVDRAVNLLGATAGGIYLYDELQDVLTFAVGTGFVAEFLGRTLKPGEGLAGRVFTRRQAMTVADYATWPGRATAYDGDPRLKAQLAVPLYVTETVFGVLTIQGAEGQVFSEHDVWLVEMFGSQAAVALENARLHAETQRRANLLAALNTAGRAMSSSLDLESVLNQVIEEVRSLLGAEGASIILRDPTSGELVFAASAGQGSQDIIGTRIPINTGIAGWVMRERQSALVHDAQTDPRFWNVVDSKTSVTTRSLVAVPLKFKASVWGVIEAINRAGGRFDKLDQEMLEALASSAAIAIENARLYAAEKEQRRLVEQSQLQLAESEKLAATGRLAATLAHEINNPLQAISNSLQLMLNFDLEPDERRECVQLATSEVERLAGIVNRTLDFARRPEAEMKPASLNQIVEKVLALASKYLQHRHIALEQDLAPDLQPIRANPDELAQVFLNLILNAVDAMPESGTLRVATGSAEDSLVTAAFSDTGCGILPENLERVFEPFYTTKSDGTGLGLSVSAGVVSRHGGKIAVQSQVNQGTTFTVWLPAATG